jgi:hypothetical protein
VIDLEELKRDLAKLNEQLRELRQDVQRNYSPRREIIRQRRRALSLVLAIVVMLAAGGWITQRATLAREHRIVAECFLLPSRLDAATVRRCSRTFPGYSEIQGQSRRNSQIFIDLQRRVAKLEAQQRKSG